MTKNYFLLLVLSVLLASCSNPTEVKTIYSDPLALWNDGEVKTAISEFVKNVSDSGSAKFVAPEDRIAVFDNDGTLWCEKPLYIPVELELQNIKNSYSDNPDWQKDKLFAAIAQDDLAVLGEYETGELIDKLFATHDGQKEREYEASCYQTLSTVLHRKFGRPLKEMTFAPMVQLVRYLQDNDFKVYIVTGGEITSVRSVSEEIYNIPKENVVGSSVVLSYVSDESGTYLLRSGKIQSVNDKQIKPTNIELHIGKKPIFAAGNSDGDYQMMEYTLSNSTPSLAILVNHDDEIREYNYMQGTEKAVADASTQGWYVVSMKSDFKEIFAE